MIIRLISIIILLSSFTHRCNAKDNNDTINQIFNLIYNQQFQQADSLLIIHHKTIDEFYFKVLKLDLYWWKYISDKKKGCNNKCIKLHIKNYLLQSKNTDQPVSELIGLSYKLRFKLYRKNLITALRLHKNIKNLLNLNKNHSQIIEPEFFHLYKNLFQYFDLYIHKKLFLNKEVHKQEKILANIESFIDSDDIIIRTISYYFLGKIYLEIEIKPEKGKIYFNHLVEEFPNNEIFRQLEIECLK